MTRVWRGIADWAKVRQWALTLADKLGRGHGRLRLLDALRLPPARSGVPALSGWQTRDLSAVWLGHATVLLRIGGLTILTDPALSTRIGLGLGLITAGPARLSRPALTVRQLPPIDLILLSHAHFDHLDMPTLARLNRRTPVITAANTADLAHSAGFTDVREIGWDQLVMFRGLKITARQVVHWGARTFFDRQRGYNAYLIESARHRILFGGDSAYYDGFGDLGVTGGVDLAMLGIGAYDPYHAAHATPEEVWAMAGHMGARHLMPIHHRTFRLSHEPTDEPLRRLYNAAGQQSHQLVGVELGSEWILPQEPPASV